MFDVVRSLVPVEVHVPGLGVYTIRRPTLQEALTVMAGAEDGWDDIRVVVGKWLPLRLSSALMAAGPSEAIPALLSLLSVGIPIRHENDEKRLKRKLREMSWWEVVAEYATWRRMTTDEVLSEAWPAFVAMHAEMDRMRAREQLRAWEAAAGAQTGKIDGMIERAGYEIAEYDEPESMNDEWFDRQMNAAKAWRNRNQQGEA